MVQHIEVLEQAGTVVQSGEFVMLLRRRPG
jgi:hypothetical protein